MLTARDTLYITLEETGEWRSVPGCLLPHDKSRLD
jgi:hypothetical protein